MGIVSETLSHDGGASKAKTPRHQIRHAKKRLLVFIHIAIGVLFTSLACFLNELSVNVVQSIHPGYPRQVILAAYMPRR